MEEKRKAEQPTTDRDSEEEESSPDSLRDKEDQKDEAAQQVRSVDPQSENLEDR